MAGATTGSAAASGGTSGGTGAGAGTSRINPAKPSITVRRNEPKKTVLKEPVLESETLKKVDFLKSFVHGGDVNAAPPPDIAKGSSEKAAVKAIQKALNLFRDARSEKPIADPEGDYQDGTADAVTAFQKHYKESESVFLDQFGVPKSKVKTNGEVDRVTLIVLDRYAKELEAADANAPAQGTQPAAGQRRARGGFEPEWDWLVPTKKPVDDPELPREFIFDAAGPPSIAFGLRMYRALREWSKGGPLNLDTKYSTNSDLGDAKYAALCRDRFLEADKAVLEWPRIDKSHPLIASRNVLKALNTSSSEIQNDEQLKSLTGVECYKVFTGSNPWVASGYTNCCNAQLAAFFVSLGDWFVHVRSADGDRSYAVGDALGEKDVGEVGDAVPGLTHDQTRLFFESLMVKNFGGVTKDVSGRVGKPKGQWGKYGAAFLASKLLGIGTAIPCATNYDGRYTNDQAVLPGVRIGDWANTQTHSWLVGDVRYRMFFELPDDSDDRKKREKDWKDKNWSRAQWKDGNGPPVPSDLLIDGSVELYADQSSFASTASDADGWAGPRWFDASALRSKKHVPYGDFLKDQQLIWLTKNEAMFESRLATVFAEAAAHAPRTLADGKKRRIAKIEVYDVACLSANALWKGSEIVHTLYGRFWTLRQDIVANWSEKTTWSEDPGRETGDGAAWWAQVKEAHSRISMIFAARSDAGIAPLSFVRLFGNANKPKPKAKT